MRNTLEMQPLPEGHLPCLRSWVHFHWFSPLSLIFSTGPFDRTLLSGQACGSPAGDPELQQPEPRRGEHTEHSKNSKEDDSARPKGGKGEFGLRRLSQLHRGHGAWGRAGDTAVLRWGRHNMEQGLWNTVKSGQG